MKNIEIKIFKETRMVELNKFIIGNDGENLQGNLVFTFDEFVDGQARLEYVIDGKKNYIVLEKVGETYQVPILSVITKKGQIDMQVVVTQGTEDIAIFKSNLFYLTCNASINAEIEQPDEYLQWIEVANAKLNEVDNIDIDAVKENGVATITITKKDGTQESFNLYDGEGAITDYKSLENKPSINGVELVGNLSLDDINAQEKGDYLTSENDPLFKQSASYSITSQDIKNWNNKSEFSGNYDDLNGKPTIPTKTSELTNDSGYINEIPSEYVTETELNEKGYLTEHQSLDHLQEKLYSGENIKTINGVDILGSGNIEIQGGGSGITEIPIASETTLGGIKVGSNLTIEEDGTLNATASSGGSTKSIISIVGGGEKEYNISAWVWTPIAFTKALINIGDGFSYSADDNGIKILKDMTIRVEAQICYFTTSNGEINIMVTKNKNTTNSIGYSNRYDTFNNKSSTINITGRLASVKTGDIIQVCFSGVAGTYKINQNEVLSCLTLQEL